MIPLTESYLEKVKALLQAHGKPEKEVYLDLENSAPIAPDVLEAMLPYFTDLAYGNPTLTHKPGWEAYEVLMSARDEMANLLGAKSYEINFTPGESEANNLALIGYAIANKKRGKRIVVSEIEHLSIINAISLLESAGFEVAKAPVDDQGFVKLGELQNLINRETVLLSVGVVNHEIGTVQPIKEICKLAKDLNPQIAVHTDASDAVGKLSISLENLGADLVTVSSYKLLGPRGIGALCVREGLEVSRIVEGQLGTQRLWPGVENVPGVVGFARAIEIYVANLETYSSSLRSMRDLLLEGILNNVDETLLNGPSGTLRGADNVNISFMGCEGEALTVELSLHGVYVSSGSACTRRLLQPSYVLLAIGRGYEEAHGSILMKVNRLQTREDIEHVLDVVPKAVSRIRRIGGFGGDG